MTGARDDPKQFDGVSNGRGDSPSDAQLGLASRNLARLGAAKLFLGAFAIVFPLLWSLVLSLLVGWILLAFGGVLLVESISIHRKRLFAGALALALLSGATGMFLIFWPLESEAALTLAVSLILAFEGAFEISFAFELRPHRSWAGMLASGITSLVLSSLILIGDRTFLAFVGPLLGLNFIVTGVAYVALASAWRKRAAAAPPSGLFQNHRVA